MGERWDRIKGTLGAGRDTVAAAGRGASKYVAGKAVGDQARYNELSSQIDETERQIADHETGPDGHHVLEEAHATAKDNYDSKDALHREEKAAFAPIDAEHKRLTGEVKAVEARLKPLQTASETAEKAAAEARAAANAVAGRTGRKTIRELKDDKVLAEIARDEARDVLKGTPLDIAYKDAESKITAAQEKLKTAKGADIVSARTELGDAEAHIRRVQAQRRQLPEYKAWEKAKGHVATLEKLPTDARALEGLEAKALRAEQVAADAAKRLAESPDHAKLAEATTALKTHKDAVHDPALKRVTDAEAAVHTARTELRAAEGALKGHTRKLQSLEGKLGRQATRLEQAGEKWRIGKAPKGVWNFTKKAGKWGLIGGGVAAVGGLAYAALKPSGRSDNGESIQGLKDQMAENDAKLQAMQTMAPQAPMAPSGPVMMTPQGPVMMVPANNNLTQPQYQGPLVNVQNMGMGAPA